MADKKRTWEFAKTRSRINNHLADEHIEQICDTMSLTVADKSKIMSRHASSCTALWDTLSMRALVKEDDVSKLIEAFDLNGLVEPSNILKDYSNRFLEKPQKEDVVEPVLAMKEVEQNRNPPVLPPKKKELSGENSPLPLPQSLPIPSVATERKNEADGDGNHTEIAESMKSFNINQIDYMRIFQEFSPSLVDNLTSGDCRVLAMSMSWTPSESYQHCVDSNFFVNRIYSLLHLEHENEARKKILNSLFFALSVTRFEVLSQRLGKLLNLPISF
jgi:hypothetical protein